MKKLALLAVLVALAAAASWRWVDARERPWNVVLISIDTLRADRLSAYGHSRPTSPGLEKLAARGLLFEQAYSHAPKTAPAHMTVLTGLLPDAHGVRNLERDGNTSLPAGIPTLASMLRERGYRTAAVTAGGQVVPELGFDRGQDAFEMRAGAPAIFARAEEWLHSFRGRPFCLFVHTYEVHDPYAPPPPYDRLWADPHYAGRIPASREALLHSAGEDWTAQHEAFWECVDPRSAADLEQLEALYDGSIRLVDDLLAHFLGELEALGEIERTLIVFIGDHGEEFQDHGGFLHESVYQELLHVPLVIATPVGGRTDRRADLRGKRVPNVVGLVDLVPTVLDLLEIDAPDHLQGKSLLPIARGDEAAQRPLLSVWPRAGLYALRRGDWKLVWHSAPAQEQALAEVGLLRWHDVPQTREDLMELYDLATDPRELNDIAARHGAIRAELHEELAGMVGASRAFLQRHVGARTSVEVSDDLRRQLESLGYMGTNPSED